MSTPVKLDIYPFTHKGRREYQEDFLYTDPVEDKGKLEGGVLDAFVAACGTPVAGIHVHV